MINEQKHALVLSFVLRHSDFVSAVTIGASRQPKLPLFW